MGDALRFLAVSLMVGLSLIAFVTVLGALFPTRTASTRAALESLPGRAFALGLVNLGFLTVAVLVSLVLGENLWQGFFLPGLLLIGVALVLASFGLTACVQQVGQRLWPQLPPVRQSLWAGLLLVLACLLPIVGWFLLLPWLLIIGSGAFLLSFFQRKPKPGDTTSPLPKPTAE